MQTQFATLDDQTELFLLINKAEIYVNSLPASRELSIVKTKLQEARLWATQLPLEPGVNFSQPENDSETKTSSKT